MQRINKTGGWRAFRPIVDPSKCNKCGLCWLYCPDGCMVEKEEIYEPDLEYCKGCGICAEECARNAIKMEVE
jgi:pyruvate ferredoxin oxidoreductase delta subunit